MHKMGWLAALLPAVLGASVNEPMRWEWQTGYRNDNLHWHLQTGGEEGLLKYSEHYRNLQFWENALNFRVIHRDITFFLRGAGSFGLGSLKQFYANQSYTSETPNLYFNTKPWTLEGSTYLGYAVNLTADRFYKVILVPLVGYGANYEHLSRSGKKLCSGPSGALASSYSLESSFPKAERMCWFGPLFGGFFLIEPGGALKFEAGYAYHMLRLNFRTSWQEQVFLYDGAGALISKTTALNSLVVKEGSNLAHTGWVRMDYSSCGIWSIGLMSQIQYFTSRVLGSKVKNLTAGTSSSEKFKTRWTAISGAATLSRVF
jgi:hypothetical protein